jgi:hypothetical protein
MSFVTDDVEEIVDMIRDMRLNNEKTGNSVVSVHQSSLPVFISTIKQLLNGEDAYDEVFKYQGKFVHIDFSSNGRDVDVSVELLDN